jgi:hypothetical protein
MSDSDDDLEAVEFAISCGVLLRGDMLDPSEVTALLGIEPTHAGRKGDTARTSAGTERTLKTGYWRFSVDADDVRFEPAIGHALATFDHVDINLGSIAGVTDAFFDVFGTGGRNIQTIGGYFSLTAEQVARMAALGLSMEVSISIHEMEQRVSPAED